MEELREAVAVEMEILDGAEAANRILAENGCVRDLITSAQSFTFEFTGRAKDLAELHETLIRGGVQLLWFREMETSLEDVFMQITKGEVT